LAKGEAIGRRAGGGAQVRTARVTWTKARRAAFLEELAATANVARSARKAGVSESSAYLQRRKDAGFALAWAEALVEGYTRLELLMVQRALEDMAGEALPVPRDTAKAAALSERAVLQLLAHHRQSVREHREAAATRDADAPDGRAREALEARLAAMHARLTGSGPDAA
jgi:hypothetical protein